VDAVTIGLDIGSSAVRAAEIEVSPGRRVLRRYGQVGLPPGYVVDGEVVNIPAVSAAVRRLWTEAGFSHNKVVLGVSGPRVFVRQADVPALGAEDLRSSLKFDAQELIPIPMEEASFDFSILQEGQGPGEGGKETARILLVAAHRDLLRGHLATLKGAGLSAIAMDATPLSLMRVVPTDDSDGPGGVEVLVSIGAELTTVAVRDHGVPRFIRSLTVGGAKLTESIANGMHLEVAVAERLKRGSIAPGSPQLAQARQAMSTEMRDLVDDVRATIDFFLSQSDGATIDRLLVTGGASQTEGLAAALVGNPPLTVSRVDPFGSLTFGEIGLDESAMNAASAVAATAVGLALWPHESPLIRLSVLPDEVVAARRARRLMTTAACGVAGVAVVLGAIGVGQALRVHSAENQVKAAQAQVASLTTQASQLQAQTAVHGQAKARSALVVTALQGDVDWVRVLGQLAAVMPKDLSLTSFTGARTLASSSGSSSSSSTPGVGTLSFNVTGTGGLPAVSNWLKGLQSDPDLSGVWVTGITVTKNGGTVTFSSTSNLTTVAESNRAKAVQP
jgi:type IV pilus assembly protein PilM